MYDIIIIGCGPAGMSAAIYALRAQKKVLILEKETIGGKISSSPLVENYPGFDQISGPDLSAKLYDQVIALGGGVELEEVVRIEEGPVKTVVTDASTYQTHAIIIASGTNYRKLGIEKEDEMIGNGISFCTVCDGAFYKDGIVAVVGGGSSAFINALSLSELCKKVYLIHRKDYFSAEEKLIHEVENQPNIEILYQTQVVSFLGTSELTGMIVQTGEQTRQLSVEGVFLSIGQIPDTEYLQDIIHLTDHKYVVSNEDCTTSVEGIFVAGDCRDKKIRQLTTAMNDGTISALHAIAYLNEKKKHTI